MGLRFLDAVDQTIQRLVAMPGTGALFDTKKPDLSGLRCSTVSGFRNHLIFYRPTREGIEIIRVLHGARDVERVIDR